MLMVTRSAIFPVRGFLPIARRQTAGVQGLSFMEQERCIPGGCGVARWYSGRPTGQVHRSNPLPQALRVE